MLPPLRSIVAGLALAALALVAHAADAPPKVFRVGVVIPFPAEVLAKRLVPVQEPFEDGLRERGWVEGRNVQVLYRPAAGLDELVRLPVDVLVTMGGEHVRAMQATTTIPIVALMQSAVKDGVIKSFSRPGGNVTGISVEGQGNLATKRLALLKEATGAKRVARLYLVETYHIGTEAELLPEYATAARALGLEVFPVFAPRSEDLRLAFAELAKRRVDAVMVAPISRLPGVEAAWDTLLELLQSQRMPAMFDLPRAVAQGGLMAYGDDIPNRARRLSYFVDRILRGAKPGELPVEQPDQFEFVVNLKAAQAIGLKIPASVLLQADRVVR